MSDKTEVISQTVTYSKPRQEKKVSNDFLTLLQEISAKVELLVEDMKKRQDEESKSTYDDIINIPRLEC